jgi:hypothetical protein
VLSNQQVAPPNGFTDVFTLAQGPPSLAPVTISSNGTLPLPNGVDPKYRPSTMTLLTTYLYNVAIQRQVNSRVAVTAAYVGNANRHGFLGSGQNFNSNEAMFVPGVSNTQLNMPFYGKFGISWPLAYYCNCFNNEYNSFQGSIKISAMQGWTMQGSYTYQRQFGDGWAYDTSYYALYARTAGQGYTSMLPRQQWTFAQTYEVPFGHGRRYGASASKAVDYALGGWMLSGITTYYSGFPFSPSLENYGSQGGQPNDGPNNRPNIGTGNPYSGAQGNRNQWFVGGIGSAFLIPSANTFGNYPINTLFGPHFIQQDLSLSKSFRITERISFMLKTDAANVFNHTNLGLPNSDVQSPSAGQITGLAGGAVMRQLQFSGTVKF